MALTPLDFYIEQEQVERLPRKGRLVMQLHLKREEKEVKVGGVFSSKKKTEFLVHFRMELTEEERAAYDKLGIGEYIIGDRWEYDELDMTATISGLMREDGGVARSDDINQIQSTEDAVKSAAKSAADQIRSYMEGGSEKEEVIEL